LNVRQPPSYVPLVTRTVAEIDVLPEDVQVAPVMPPLDELLLDVLLLDVLLDEVELDDVDELEVELELELEDPEPEYEQ
jgi:hypothetical protein